VVETGGRQQRFEAATAEVGQALGSFRIDGSPLASFA
jgi:hypothetical protein